MEKSQTGAEVSERQEKPVVETATGLKRGNSPIRREPENGLWSGKAERAEEAAGGMSEVAGQER
jgi:hypothetical protein